MIAIIDYGMGNLHSVKKAFKRVGAEAIITNDKKEIAEADKIVLPGVGHFKMGMENLRKLGLIEILNKKVIGEKTPFLGICLGAQLITKYSEEGNVGGLGWIDGETLKFNLVKGLKVPHMGWNSAEVKKKSYLFNNLNNKSQFYFVHSYYLKCKNKEDVLAMTNYGKEFVCAVQKENIYGVQFHPEKSHEAGLQIIKNFIEIGE